MFLQHISNLEHCRYVQHVISWYDDIENVIKRKVCLFCGGKIPNIKLPCCQVPVHYMCLESRIRGFLKYPCPKCNHFFSTIIPKSTNDDSVEEPQTPQGPIGCRKPQNQKPKVRHRGADSTLRSKDLGPSPYAAMVRTYISEYHPIWTPQENQKKCSICILHDMPPFEHIDMCLLCCGKTPNIKLPCCQVPVHYACLQVRVEDFLKYQCPKCDHWYGKTEDVIRGEVCLFCDVNTKNIKLPCCQVPVHYTCASLEVRAEGSLKYRCPECKHFGITLGHTSPPSGAHWFINGLNVALIVLLFAFLVARWCNNLSIAQDDGHCRILDWGISSCRSWSL